MRGEALIRHLDGVSGVLAGSEPYTREVLAASKLRAIALAGVGYDAIDMQAANDLGIAITIVPGTNEHSVAEQTIALLFGVYRDVARRDAEARRGQWEPRCLWRLSGKTIGLVGLGRIGRAVVPRAVGLGLKVLAYDPSRIEISPREVRSSFARSMICWPGRISSACTCRPRPRRGT